MWKRFQNVDWKRVGRISGWTALVVVFVVSVGFTGQRREAMTCSGVQVHIDDTIGHSFVQVTDIESIIRDKYGIIEGRPLHAINTALLESIIRNNPFVKTAEVFSSIDGKLYVEVIQRTPIVRVINQLGESFYIDEQGTFMPLSGQYTARVPVANGYLFDREAERNIIQYSEEQRADTSIKRSRIDEVFRVAQFLQSEPFWQAQAEQLYVNLNGDIELVPRVGNHTILLGDASRLEEKFRNLKWFYREELNKKGWGEYKTINLKYHDQVVAAH
jgi:cell division protein FtsQ